MRPADRAAFGQLVKDVHAYYRQDVSEFLLDLWWNACERFDFEQVQKAMNAHCADPDRGQFAPKVADLSRILGGTTTDRAALAWGKVHDAMSAVGAWRDVVFDDPAIHATVQDLGGWPKLCRLDLRELGVTQHRFQETYRAYVNRGRFEYPRVLQGDSGPNNDTLLAARGLSPTAPVLVGNPERARIVQAGGIAGSKAQITDQTQKALPA